MQLLVYIYMYFSQTEQNVLNIIFLLLQEIFSRIFQKSAFLAIWDEFGIQLLLSLCMFELYHCIFEIRLIVSQTSTDIVSDFILVYINLVTMCILIQAPTLHTSFRI